MMSVFLFTSLGNGYYETTKQEDELTDWRTADEVENEALTDQSASQSAGSQSGSADTNMIKATAIGLSQAGFSNEQIAANLKNQGSSIAEISIAILPLCDNDVSKARAVLETQFTSQEVDSVLPIVSSETANQVVSTSANTTTQSSVSDPSLYDMVDDLTGRGYTTKQIAQVLKDGNVSLADAVQLLTQSGDITLVLSELIDAGYDKEGVYTEAVTQLKGQGYDAQSVMDILADEVKDGTDKKTTANAVILTKVMISAGYTGKDIVNALGTVFGSGYKTKKAAEILKGAEVSVKDAVTALSDMSSVMSDRVTALIDGGFTRADAYEAVVIQLKADGLSDTQIVETLKPAFNSKENDASLVAKTLLVENYLSGSGLQACVMFLVNNDYSFEDITELMGTKGYTREEISDAVASSIGEIVMELKADGKSLDEIVQKFRKTSGGINFVSELVEQLLNNGFDKTQVLVTVVYYGGSQREVSIGIKNADPSAFTQNQPTTSVDYSVEQGVIDAFTNNDYNMTDTASVFKGANVSAVYAYGVFRNNLDLTQTVETLAGGGYAKSSVYVQVIRELDTTGETSAESIVSQFVSLGFVKADTASAAPLASAMIGYGISAQDTVEAIGTLYGDKYSAKTAALILKEGNLTEKQALSGIAGANINGEEVSIISGVSALVDAKYEKENVFIEGVNAFKDKGLNAEEIVTKFNDAKLVEKKQDSAGLVAKVLIKANFSEEDVVASLSVVYGDKYTVKEAAGILKHADVKEKDAFGALIGYEFNGESVSVTDVVDAMINVKADKTIDGKTYQYTYQKKEVFSEGISRLKEQGVSGEEIVDQFKDAKLVSATEKSAGELAEGFFTAGGYTEKDIIESFSALFGDKYTTKTAATILFKSGASVEQAFEGLSTTEINGSLVSLADVVFGMLDATYKKEDVYNVAVSNLTAQDKSAEEIVQALTGVIVVEPEFKDVEIADDFSGTTRIERQVVISPEQAKNRTTENAGTLVSALMNNGISATDALASLSVVFGNDFSPERVAKAAKEGDVDAAAAFTALQEIDFGEALGIAKIAGILNGAKYEKSDVYSNAVKEMKDSSLEDIITELNKASDGEITAALSSNGFGVDSIAGYYEAQGKSIAQIATIMNKAGVNSGQALKALEILQSAEGQSTAELSAALIKNGYKKENVYEAAIDALMDLGYSNSDIFMQLMDQSTNNKSGQETAAVLMNEILKRNTQATPI